VSNEALVSTEAGRTFVGWFERTAISDDWSAHVGAIPLSRVYEVADEARRRAAAWHEFASALATRATQRPSSGRCS
jgi:hypothetical protein